MKKICLGFRVLLESVLLWFGGCLAALLLISWADASTMLKPLVGGHETPVFSGLCAAVLAGVLWIIIARKKEMGDRMHTGVYIALNLLALVPPFMTVWAYLHSFD